MDEYNSDGDYANRVRELIISNPSKRPKLPMKYENFFEIIKLYPCLFNKSQTPKIKKIKQNALKEIHTKIENIYGINLSGSQIRKKLENMKMRAKTKRDKIQMGDKATKFKCFEKHLLKLMDYKQYKLSETTKTTIMGLTDPEECDISAESSKCFKYEAEDEMSQDKADNEEQEKSLKPQPPLPSKLDIIPGIEIKSETHQFDQIDFELNSVSESFTSDEEEKDPATILPKSGFGIRESEFFDIIKRHGCLFEKSQAPHMKAIKQGALEAIKGELKSIHGIILTDSQIRKKITNMKGRVKGKLYNSIRRNSPKYKLKTYERKLLNLMKLYKVTESELCGKPNTSDDSNEAASEVEEPFEKAHFPTSRCLPKSFNSTPRTSENNEFSKFSVLEMQKEVLIEQKQLNKQQKELNSLQKEIFNLKKEKLLLEIDLLKKNHIV